MCVGGCSRVCAMPDWWLRPEDTVAAGRCAALSTGPPLLAFGVGEDQPTCLVAQAVNESLGAATAAAEAVRLRAFAGITLGALARDFRGRWARSAAAGTTSRCLLQHHAA